MHNLATGPVTATVSRLKIALPEYSHMYRNVEREYSGRARGIPLTQVSMPSNLTITNKFSHPRDKSGEKKPAKI